MRLAPWILLASLASACALGADPVFDGGPISGETDLGDLDVTTGFLDPPDVVVELDAGDDAGDDALDAPDEDGLVAEDRVDAPVVIDLGRCMGECAPGATRACGNCGRQTCADDCTWGACGGEGSCAPGATRGCGNCGRQTCTSACAWGACGGAGACAPGQRRAGSCDPCSEQVCSSACQWGGCALRAGSACEYRSGRNSRACSACRCGLQWCLPACQWSTSCVSCCTTCGGCQ
ncbi:MAG: hypothetical protein R3A48_14680 [Polyangiales bacterium]